MRKNSQIAQPYKVVKQFFDDYSPGEIRQALQEQVNTCLSTENTAFASPEKRAALLHNHDRITELFEAIFLITREKKEKGIFIAS
jgi:hypothetical protein